MLFICTNIPFFFAGTRDSLFCEKFSKTKKNLRGVVLKNKVKSDLIGLDLENQILNLLNLVVLKTF